MPSVLSKLVDKLLMTPWSLPYNCYEIGHAWEPSCSASAVDLSLDVTEKAIGMYSALYFANFAFQRRYNIKMLTSTLANITRSSSFLGFNCLAMFTLVCVLRKVSGKFYFSLFAAIPAFLGSYLAVFIEHPGRRKALAFYCANIASECIYRVALRHSYVRPLPRGEVALFTVSISLLLYIASRYGLRRDPIGMALKLILGRTEFKSSKSTAAIESGKTKDTEMINNNYYDNNNRVKSLSDDSNELTNKSLLVKQIGPPSSFSPLVLMKKLSTWIMSGKHSTCGHSSSCLLYSLNGFGTSFLGLWFGQAALVAGLKISSIRRDPSLILRAFTNRKKLELCLFASLFTGIYRSSRCSLRWITGTNEPWHSAVAGALSGPAMIHYPSPMIAINIAWKCLEWALQQVCSMPHAPSFDTLVPLLYAASVNIIFVTLVLEPSCLRPSYIRFIDTITHHKLHQVNRGLLKLFGTDAHIGYEEFFPNLVPEFCSNKFIESVFVWML
ncbi:transmembrane protein 135-like [Tetranychus urticae]|uniref:transmembrane protein 135-like n=1 Tax=Tetranychus urticae TaxID=32264 RepID=UPI0003567E96|nr:transmembrane protein 135-like [Tetranychus urticae]